MKGKRRVPAVLLSLLMILCLLAGCSKPAASAPETQPQTESVTETPAETETSAEAAEPAEREITDMAGRTVTVPTEIESVFSSSPTSAIYLYTLIPDKLLGWNYELNDIEKSVILEKYHSLPNFGMGDKINYEAVIAANPTIAVNVGTINDKMVSECDALTESLGIPVIAVDGDLLKSPESYRFLGDLFQVEDEAEKLAAYAEKTFDDIANMNVPEDKKVRMYYGNGEDSLETAPIGSSHAQLIDLVNAVNVADLELGDGSRIQISAEQLLTWDPDVIVVNGEPKSNMSGGSAADAILNDPN